MKVLHVINTLSSGGAERHLLTLAGRQKDGGADVAVAFLREHVRDCLSLRRSFEDRAIRLFDLRAPRRYDCGFPARLARVIARTRPDIVHTHQPRADVAGAIARHAAPDAAWVCSIHDIHDATWSARYALPMLDRVWRKPDAVIAISSEVARWLTVKRRVPRNLVHVIEYGIETAAFERPPCDLRQVWGIGDQPLIGSIGRLEPRKGHDSLIRAMPLVLGRFDRAQLLIAGHDPDGFGARLRALAADLGVARQVALIGFARDTASFLGALDVFAFLSRAEGFGQVVVEAMAAARPVVVSDIPPLNGIIEPGVSGVAVTPEDPASAASAIAGLLEDAAGAGRMGERARLRAEECFSAERMVRETSHLYERVVRSKKAA